MSKPLREQVWERARGRCEYCQMLQELDVQPFQLDHIRAKKHGGATTEANSALSCLPCNAFKGPNVAGYDPDTGVLVALFNPRIDQWEEHFAWDGARLVGTTPTGRATIVVLRINAADRVEHRRLLIEAELFPRKDM
jgi:hypothetical protein